MKNTEWPPSEVANVAGGSGKPLEVQCALAFLKAGWSAHLSTYFADGAVPRELDVLAGRDQVLGTHAGRPVMCRFRALVSCKGFRPTCSPVVYSVSKDEVPAFEETVLLEPAHLLGGGLAKEAASLLMTNLGLGGAHPPSRST
jgi:hypothetical protein